MGDGVVREREGERERELKGLGLGGAASTRPPEYGPWKFEFSGRRAHRARPTEVWGLGVR